VYFSKIIFDIYVQVLGNRRFIYIRRKSICRMHMEVEHMGMVVVVVEVVVGLGCMVERELGRSSCSDVSRLVVVVGLVQMGVLVDLVVLEVLERLDLLGFLVVRVVRLVLAHLGLLVVPLVLGLLVVLELVVEVVEVGVGVVEEEVVVVGKGQLVLRES
jgi:hypothetical protein